MSVDEQIWFVIALGGFLIFFETAITKMLQYSWAILHKYIKSMGDWKESYNGWAKMVTGFIIFLIAIFRIQALAVN